MKTLLLALLFIALPAHAINLKSPGTPAIVSLQAGIATPVTFVGKRGCVIMRTADTTGTTQTELKVTLGSSSKNGRAQSVIQLGSSSAGNYKGSVTALDNTPIAIDYSDFKPTTRTDKRTGKKTTRCAG